MKEPDSTTSSSISVKKRGAEILACGRVAANHGLDCSGDACSVQAAAVHYVEVILVHVDLELGAFYNRTGSGFNRAEFDASRLTVLAYDELHMIYGIVPATTVEDWGRRVRGTAMELDYSLPHSPAVIAAVYF